VLISAHFTDKAVDLSTYMPKWTPDLILCRGGFDYYDTFLRRYPQTPKVYYGAGTRIYPTSSYTDYACFLVDTDAQRDMVRSKTHAKVSKIIKPAATLFAPVYGTEKTYDVAFMANAAQYKLKRHEFFLRAMAGRGLSILMIGNKRKNICDLATSLGLDVTWAGWHLRKDLPALLSSCKMGAICTTSRDSCPRVIPEYLACGLPFVATKNMNFDHKRYTNGGLGGIIVDEKVFGGAVAEVAASYTTYRPYHTYTEKLAMPVAVRRLVKILKGIL